MKADLCRPEWVICDHCGEIFGYEDNDDHRCPPVVDDPRCPVCGDWERLHAEGCPRHPQYRGYNLMDWQEEEAVPW